MLGETGRAAARAGGALQAQRPKHPVSEAMTLELLPDGALRAVWFGAASPPTEKKLAANTWTHVAFRYAGQWGAWAKAGKGMQERKS